MAERDAELSIVIITKNEERYIGKCIASIIDALSNILYPYEIILVDSASSDNTPEIAKKYPIKIIQINKSNFLSPAAGLYIGFKNCNGDLIFFINGDMTVDNDWFNRSIPILTSDDKIAGIGGKLTEFRNSVGKNNIIKILHGGDRVEKYLGGGATIYKKKVLEEVGPFNPYLYGEEEAELGYRISRAGYKLLRINAQMAHHWKTYSDKKEMIKRDMKYIKGYGQILRNTIGTELFWEHVKRLKIAVAAAFWAFLSIIFFLLGVLLFLAGHSMSVILGILMFECSVFIWFSIKKKSLKRGFISLTGWFLKGLAVLQGFLIGLKKARNYPLNIRVIKE